MSELEKIMEDRIINSKQNNPPRDEFELLVDEIDLIHMEAKNWLDGSIIQNQTEADCIGGLLGMARAFTKKADDARKIEKKPHDDAAKAVQDKYKSILEKAEQISTVCKKVSDVWLIELDKKNRAEAEKARKEADEKMKAAQTAIRSARDTSLEEKETAEAVLKDAKIAEAIAKKAENTTAKIKTGGKSASLRTYYTPEITDWKDGFLYYWKKNQLEFKELVLEMAQKDINSGIRTIPGITIIEEKRTA